jgi:hypothetical protein
VGLGNKDNLAIAAFAISIVSVVFSGTQLGLQYNNNRIAVRPRLDWRYDYNMEEYLFRIRLMNVGLGPADVKDIHLIIDDEDVGNFNSDVCTKLDSFIVSSNQIDSFDVSKSNCWHMADGEELYMKAGEEIVLYQLGPSKIQGVGYVSDETQNHIGIQSNYCSFYDDCEVLR